MGIVHLTAAQLARAAESPLGRDELSSAAGISAVVVELDGQAPTPSLAAARHLACVVVGVARETLADDRAATGVDVLLAAHGGASSVVPLDGVDAGLATLLEAIERTPLASTALTMLLRGSGDRSTEEGLWSESLVYSLLQSGPEFRGRVADLRRPPANHFGDGQTVAARREGEQLLITLTRPHVHNALDRSMRDELVAALTVAEADPTVAVVELRGDGPSFCSGGDLSEFGTLPDPVTAHMVRMTRSVAELMAVLHERLHVRVHGACIGAGVELAAFAGRVTAAADTWFWLPELSFGLVPGAGGTVSLPRRIGRHRTAWLALTGDRLDASTAFAWGLVDEVVATPG